MTEDELATIAATVERHLSARRGRDHILSPPDFQLLREWHAAGVSVATICAGIDDAVAAGGVSVSSLQYCRRFVEALTRPARS